jgi:citrate lyase beta subunit
MFHGDTLNVETEVIGKRDSRSKPDQGIVRFRHVGRNQRGIVVIEFERTVLVRKHTARNGAVGAPAEPVERLRRSVLFVPGDSMRKMSKAVQLDADSLILDLEDGVAANRKQEARQAVIEALGTLDFGRRERLIRLNPFPSLFPTGLEGLPADDLPATIDARPDGYVIPKVDTPEQVRVVDNYLTRIEDQRNWPAHSIRLLIMIETAKGIVNLNSIAQASPRLEALIFGAEDLASDIGAKRTPTGWEIFYARSTVVTAAAAYGLQSIDMVFIDLNDLQGLEAECQFARQLGFGGKTIIHPRQVEVANRIFAPSPEEIDWALRLSQAFETHQAAGTGAFDFEGKMVDLPIMRAAEGILVRARRAGLLK